MEVTINIEHLKSIGLTLSQYIYLWSLYSQVKVKYLEISKEGLDNLIDRFYLTKNGEEYVLLENGLELFEPSNGLFEDFIKLFPTRVTNTNGESRVLSPVSVNSMSGKKMKAKFYRITGNKGEFQKHVIRCLENELNLRKKEGSLYYMRNVETWLNKATWEDYEYLLEQPKKEESKGFKSSEIRL
jgi:hypothetical protein